MQIKKILSIFLISCVVVAALPFYVFAELPYGGELRSTFSPSREFYIDEEEGIGYYLFEDKPSLMFVPVYDEDSIYISGSSDVIDWGDLRIRFARQNSSSGQVGLAYDNYFQIGASWFTDSNYNWDPDECYYGITLTLKGDVFNYPYWQARRESAGSDEIFDVTPWTFLNSFSPNSYDGQQYFSGVFDPFKGLSNANTLDYSSSHTWSYWLGHELSSDPSSDFYYQDYYAVLDGSYTFFNLRWSMGDNKSDFEITITSEDTFNFASAYQSALSTNMQDFTFGLTLSQDALSFLDTCLYFDYKSDLYTGSWNAFGGVDITSINDQRYYGTVIDPLYSGVDSDYSNPLVYGVYYYLVPVDSNGNELSNFTIGPYLFNEGNDLSDLIDINTNYKIKLAVYFDTIYLTLKYFNTRIDTYSLFNMTPAALMGSGSNASMSFGTNGDLVCQIYNLSNFAVTPTIYADGVSISDLTDNINSGFAAVSDTLEGINTNISNQGVLIRSAITNQTSQIIANDNANTSQIISSVSSAANTISDSVDEAADSINEGIDEATDTITEGYDNSEMTESQQELDSALNDLDAVEDMEITDPDGNEVSFFDYIKSVFSSWSWPSFTTEFTNALSEIAQIINMIYSSLPEPFQTVIMFLILFTVLAIVLNFYKYYNSG